MLRSKFFYKKIYIHLSGKQQNIINENVCNKSMNNYTNRRATISKEYAFHLKTTKMYNLQFTNEVRIQEGCTKIFAQQYHNYSFIWVMFIKYLHLSVTSPRLDVSLQYVFSGYPFSMSDVYSTGR